MLMTSMMGDTTRVLSCNAAKATAGVTGSRDPHRRRPERHRSRGDGRTGPLPPHALGGPAGHLQPCAALGVGGAEDAAPQEAPERTGPPCGCSLAESQPLPGPFLSCVFFPQTSRSKCQFLLIPRKEFSERASVRLECFI